MTAVAPPVLIIEETFSAPAAPLSPKVKALRDRLANQMCEKDDINVKDKVEKRMAKAAALVQKNIMNKPTSPQKGENHLLNSMAHQMEENSRIHETAAKDRERQEKAEEALAALAAERASKIVENNHKLEEANAKRVTQEEEFKTRAQFNLTAMDERLADFHDKRQEEYKAMCNNHVDRVARREALLDRMHDKGIVQTDQMRAFQEQRQTMAEARRLEQLREKEVKADTSHVSQISQQVKTMKEEELAKKKADIEAAQEAAAERRAAQLKLKNTERSPKMSPKSKKAREEESSGWFGVISSLAVAVGAAAVCYMSRR